MVSTFLFRVLVTLMDLPYATILTLLPPLCDQ